MTRLPLELTHLITKQSDNCWLWKGTITRKGYGMYCLKGQIPKWAHRLVYELLIGPIGLFVQLHHTCENNNCVNPEHLKPITLKNHCELHKDRNKKCYVEIRRTKKSLPP